MKLAFTIVSMLAAGSAFAAIPPKTAVPVPTKIIAGHGAVTGGVAGSGFSLTNVTLAATPKKERVVIDIGDLKGQPLRGYPGYYHAELQDHPNRLIVDFAQTPTVLVNEKTLAAKFKGSKMISRSSILIDPTDQTLSLVLDFRRPVKAQVFQVAGKKGTSRVVVDLL